ncbi:MAG TPA: hypothetical protein VFN35_08435 [Ktedonobacteraceae bacterium]|nr:hypothetical protein [Ktedonobacteraceae bacterium]
MQQSQRDQSGWRVLLIGGSSGVGKTSVAQALGRKLGISVLLVDDIRMALQQITMPGEQPGLHYFLARPAIWQKPPETLCEGFITVGNALMKPLTAIIAHHVFSGSAGPVIIVGDGILPALAAQRDFSSLHYTSALVSREVRSAFLVESDEDILARNIHPRGPASGESSSREQQTFVRASWLYGQWLKRQADHYNLPIVEARPWESQVERVLQAIGS